MEKAENNKDESAICLKLEISKKGASTKNLKYWRCVFRGTTLESGGEGDI